MVACCENTNDFLQANVKLEGQMIYFSFSSMADIRGLLNIWFNAKKKKKKHLLNGFFKTNISFPPAFTHLICPLQFLKNGKQEVEGSNPIYKGSKPIGPGAQGVLSRIKWLPILMKIKRKCKMYLADN